MMGGAVAMTDEDVLVVDMVDGTVAGSFIFLLVTLQEECTTAKQHVLALAVEVRPFHRPAATYGDAIVALGTSAAVVPRNEQVIIAVVFKDERSLDGIGTGMFRRGVLTCGLVVRVVAACDGTGLFAAGYMHGRVETGQLDAVPEGTPDEPRPVVVVNDKVWVNGVPVVAFLTGGDDAALVLPQVGTQRTAAEQTDG